MNPFNFLLWSTDFGGELNFLTKKYAYLPPDVFQTFLSLDLVLDDKQYLNVNPGVDYYSERYHHQICPVG